MPGCALVLQKRTKAAQDWYDMEECGMEMRDLHLKDMLATFQIGQRKEKGRELWTKEGEKIRELAQNPDFVPLAEYPRPQMERSTCTILNGWWDYRITSDAHWKADNPGMLSDVCWEADGKILVPFSPETALSGVRRQLKPNETLWYRRKVAIEKRQNGERLLLHFGAVDQECRVYWNGEKIGEHLGGYLPFTLDVTDSLEEGENMLIVICRDISDTGWRARGKQKLRAKGMFYTAQSGIWQTVWMEWVPAMYIRGLWILPDYDGASLRVEARMEGKIADKAQVCGGQEARGKTSGSEMDRNSVFGKEKEKDFLCEMRILERTEEGITVCTAQGVCKGNTVIFTAELTDFKPWTPESPFLYDLEICIGDDKVYSYFGMRTFTVEKQEDGIRRFCINHKPYFLNGVLDQGYWPEGLYTAPADQLFVNDIKNMKKLGFNMMRKHCKLEPLRWYYHCDRLGMIVWQDMVNGGETYNMVRVCYTQAVIPALKKRIGWSARASGRLRVEGKREWLRECQQTLHHLSNVTSLAVWVPFNEGWGQFATEKVTEMIRRIDPTRPIDAASGWFDFEAGDFKSEHNYFDELTNPKDKAGRASVISEYGGLALKIDGHVFNDRSYGYRNLKDEKEFTHDFTGLQNRLRLLEQEGLSGAVYTQVSDIEEEINGIYTYDRQKCKLIVNKM